MNRSKLCGNCVFPQNLHTRKLVEITILFKVHKSEYVWKIIIYISYLSILNAKICNLTHYSPVLLFFTPWKYQKTFTFSDIFRGYRKATPGCNGLIKCIDQVAKVIDFEWSRGGFKTLLNINDGQFCNSLISQKNSILDILQVSVNYTFNRFQISSWAFLKLQKFKNLDFLEYLKTFVCTSGIF